MPELKPIKFGKKPGTRYCLGCKDYTNSFKPQEVKITNKMLREKFKLCWLSIQQINIFKTKTQQQK